MRPTLRPSSRASAKLRPSTCLAFKEAQRIAGRAFRRCEASRAAIVTPSHHPGEAYLLLWNMDDRLARITIDIFAYSDEEP